MGSYEENKLHMNILYRELLTSSGSRDDRLGLREMQPKYFQWQGTSAEMDIVHDDHLFNVLSRNDYRELKTFIENINIYKNHVP